MVDESVLARLLLDRAATLADGDGHPVAMPDARPIFEPPADRKYWRVTLFSNGTAWEGLSAGRTQVQGLLMITLHWPEQKGVISPREVAKAAADLFPKGLRLSEGGTTVRVNRAPVMGTR